MQDYGTVRGVSFAVWAPNAGGVSVVGDFNSWDGRLHQMRRLGASGVWEIFVPDIGPGALYKFEIHNPGALAFLKTDPYALYTEVPPATSSIVYEPTFRFTDDEWIERRARESHLRRPISIYEVHLGSWRRIIEERDRSLTYRETAPALADYCLDMGFTHVEFLPLKGYPFSGSWGYQVANYYAATARFGTPDDFRYLVDYLHRRGLGVIMDWVPAHFPKDVWSLGRFDGTALYEHADPRQGEHPDWGTYIFNYGRPEVRNFLIANALFWIKECHIDGLRVDAVASMLYLDYSRTEGRWIPNQYGGRENIEAISFMRELNDTVHTRHPGVMMIAEESTSWPLVTKPPYDGGLGFDFKWNMGWMHDTLEYFKKDPIYRRYFHHSLTFSLVYAWSENFILPLSHDEVVHMKGSLINKMVGDRWQKFANLRALYGYMWSHPGKKLLFMGGEIGQWREWSEERSLDWHLLDEADHAGLQSLVRDMNRLLQQQPRALRVGRGTRRLPMARSRRRARERHRLHARRALHAAPRRLRQQPLARPPQRLPRRPPLQRELPNHPQHRRRQIRRQRLPRHDINRTRRPPLAIPTLLRHRQPPAARHPLVRTGDGMKPSARGGRVRASSLHHVSSCLAACCLPPAVLSGRV